jgi:phage-related protein|uniref:Uncharacterized protein n=1 Tax=viral metagenome TaxID=1070528 RepID=A0A6C0J4I9_9ZZZZ
MVDFELIATILVVLAIFYFPLSESFVSPMEKTLNNINQKTEELQARLQQAKTTNTEEYEQLKLEYRDLLLQRQKIKDKLQKDKATKAALSVESDPPQFLSSLISSAFGAFSSLANAPLDIIIQAVKQFVNIFIGFITSIVDLFKSVLTYVNTNVFKNILDSINILFGAVKTVDTTLEINKSVTTGIQENSSNLISILNGIITNISQFFAKIFKDFYTAFESLLTNNIGTTIVSSFTKLFEVSKTVEQTLETNKNVTSGIQNTGKGILDTIISIFKNIATMLTTMITSIYTAFETLFSYLIANVFNNMLASMNSLFVAVKTTETTFSKSKDSMESIRSSMVDAIDEIKTLFSKLTGHTFGELSNMTGIVDQFNISVGTLLQLTNANEIAINEVKGKFNTAMSNLKGDITKVKSKLDEISGGKVDMPNPIPDINYPSISTSALQTILNNIETYKIK